MQLRDYQEKIVEQGSEILLNHKIVYLAMEPRTGKTITALSIAGNNGFKNVLFVTKLKAIPSISKDYKGGAFTYGFKVINHESLHKLSDIEVESFDLIICDEHHSVGAYPKPSKRAQMLKIIIGQKPVIMLSGTPSPESLSQLYHQFWVSAYSPFKGFVNFYKWAKVYVNVGIKYLHGGKQMNDYSKGKEKEIKESTDHLFITYSQKEAGFSQEVKESVLTVKMNPYINQIRSILKKDLVYTDPTYGFEIVADTAVRLQQLDHQLSSGTVIDHEGKRRVLDNSKGLFIYNNFTGNKIVVFYKFKAERDLLKTVFPDSTEVAEEFQEGKSDVFIGQFVSSREGLRLDLADFIIFFNIDFSSLSYFQSKERIMSFERTKEAKLYFIFSEHGIEKQIYQAVTNKKDYTLAYYLRNEKIDKKRFRVEGPSEGYTDL